VATRRGIGCPVVVVGERGGLLGSDDLDVAAPDGVVGDDTVDAAEVIDVAVGVDHRRHRSFTEVLVAESEAGGRGLSGGERVDHDPTLGAFEEADVGHVVTACLPQPGCDLEQAVVVVEPGVVPEAGVDRVGWRFRLAFEVVARHVPHRQVVVGDDASVVGGDEAPGPSFLLRGARVERGGGADEYVERRLGGCAATGVVGRGAG
jgi:hypothetical protein